MVFAWKEHSREVVKRPFMNVSSIKTKLPPPLLASNLVKPIELFWDPTGILVVAVGCIQ